MDKVDACLYTVWRSPARDWRDGRRGVEFHNTHVACSEYLIVELINFARLKHQFGRTRVQRMLLIRGRKLLLGPEYVFCDVRCRPTKQLF